ncbi:MAG TPA: hypothetical protein PLG59_14905 [bacterium]|nr:hypothetical protein [bacterium]
MLCNRIAFTERHVIARSRPESAKGGDVAISGLHVRTARLPRFARNDDIVQTTHLHNTSTAEGER